MRLRGVAVLAGMLLAGAVVLWAAPAGAQVFLGEYCWTGQPNGKSAALIRLGVTNLGGSYFVLQGYVDGIQGELPLLFGSGIASGGSIYLTFTNTTTSTSANTNNAGQMQGVLNGSLNGSLWELTSHYNPDANAAQYTQSHDTLTLTYNPSCTLP